MQRWITGRFGPGHVLAAVLLLSGCTAARQEPALSALPAASQYCLAAQRIVTHTNVPMVLQVQPDFDAFVKSKALIEGPTIQQFEWRDGDGRLLAISCKLKSADHLVEVFGPASAGPDGSCQDMNRAVYRLVSAELGGVEAHPRVVFDPAETVVNEKSPGMTGPDWLAPFTLTSRDPDGSLRIHTKGFIVNFTDPRFAQLPARFRGVHYCHFIAPDYLRDLLVGEAEPGVAVGRLVEPARNMPGQ
jgi:hypothetical protein